MTACQESSGSSGKSRLDRRERKGALREMAASRGDVFARRAERAKTLGG
ncbi:hypothetical protein [Streptomyces sp. NBC_00370]